MLSLPVAGKKKLGTLVQGCHVGIVALSDPADELLYSDPFVDLDLRYDLNMPSMAILEAVHFLHKAAYTHVVIQQVCKSLKLLFGHDLKP